MNIRLKESEWIILKALWDNPPMDMRQIVRSIREQQPEVRWSYKTYHTYLRLMWEKGLIAAEERNSKVKLYRAVLTRDEAMAAEGESLARRREHFGSVGKLLLRMSDLGMLTEEDRQALLALARQLEQEGGERR